MTDATGSFERRPPATRRRVRNGVRLKGDPAAFEGWVTRAWLALLNVLVEDEQERALGLDYAREGQTTRLEIDAGGVTARVQGRLARPYQTTVQMPMLDEHQWRSILEAMAGEAFYAAKLLAREVPPALEDLLAARQLQLLPPDVQAGCDCPSGGGCRHVAAVGLLVAERLEGDPLLALQMRGLSGEEVLERLAVARAQRTRGAAAAHAEPVAPSVPRRAEDESADAFWRTGPGLAELQKLPPPHHAPHALLRRLGPSPLAGRFPLVGLLASVYDTVARHAIELRDRAERLLDDDAVE